ncbi:MAG: transposase [Gammaproteobacteria bacterium]|nr:transposase [Gammaproteobacteria bacterium]
MLNGLMPLPVWGYIILTLVLTHITIVSVTLYLHRHQAHRALDLHPIVSHFFRFWLWLTTGMVTKEWVAIHRKHHAKVETEDDPHSPVIYGISKVLWEGVELYRAEALNQETLRIYGHNTPDDWIERNVYSRSSIFGPSTMLVINFLLFGFAGLAIWGVQMAWIPFFAAGIINGVGHYWGYRNYETEDTSSNIVPLGILIGGEEMHNNHHSFASSAKFSNKWWEFDIGWMYIQLMQSIGLARVKKVASRPAIVPDKAAIDMDTVRAVINHRLYVLSHYARDVVGQVYRDELKKADSYSRDLLKRTKRLLIRDEAQLDTQSRDKLQAVLERNDTLEVVYRYKQKLRALWQEQSASHEALMQSLQEWCQQAEATGIKALEDFARTLRAYSQQPTAA